MTSSGVEQLPARLAALQSLQEPAEVVLGAVELLELVRSVERQACALRDRGVAALHQQGHSLQDIAQLTGLSRGRIHQIVARQ